MAQQSAFLVTRFPRIGLIAVGLAVAGVLLPGASAAAKKDDNPKAAAPKADDPKASAIAVVVDAAAVGRLALYTDGDTPAEPAAEDSVLVDRRSEPLQEEKEAADDAEAPLKPIPQETEYAPKPAGPKPASTPDAPAEAASAAADEVVTDEMIDGPVDAAASDATDADAESDAAETDNATVEAGEPVAVDRPEADAAATGEATGQAAAAVKTDESDDVAAAYLAEARVKRARFRDILPGEATKAELLDSWGEPAGASKTATGEVLLYEIEPFARVDVLVEQEVAEVIKIELGRQELPDRLAKRLRADEVEPVELIDDKSGDLLGVSYPEKGLLLLFGKASASATPNTPQFVTHIVVSSLDAEAFALRADNQPALAYEKRLADVQRAIEIDPENGYAHYLAAETYLATGQVDKAAEAAEAAVEANGDKTAYRLRLAEAYLEQGDYDKAALATREVLDAEDSEGVVKAAALHTMGRLAAFGDAKISEKVIGFHNSAIGMADKLATSPDTKDRRAAKRLLIEAHLAVAKEVSRRQYERKTEVVAQWIGRASGLAEEAISNDAGGLELRLLVAQGALEALANLKPSRDPQPWIEEAIETAEAIRKSTNDALAGARIDWMLGEAYYHALRVEHTRGNADKAIAYGESAIQRLMAGAVSGDIRPSAERLVGRLYFHLGAVNAVHLQNHESAVEWYEQAYPLLTGDAPDSKLYVSRRRGEALVSMAVSYWEQGEQQRAIELTVAGSELMEQAVEAGVLSETSLAVPYGNLATMHRKQGDREKSAEFARLARGVRGVATASRQTQQDSAGAKRQAPNRSARSNASGPRRSANSGRPTNGAAKTMIR